ncbi:MAG: hypothetical protein JXM79_15710 [Sedimentisphaerales bacterium]|nr:hypothetical protein [Sedimentisphaerales bacterium]
MAMRDFAGSRTLERLSMYSTGRLTAERRFEASLLKTMGELKKLQDTRKQGQAEMVETEAGSYRGQDARVTRGRDARDTARDTECVKQSQSFAREIRGQRTENRRQKTDDGKHIPKTILSN